MTIRRDRCQASRGQKRSSTSGRFQARHRRTRSPSRSGCKGCTVLGTPGGSTRSRCLRRHRARCGTVYIEAGVATRAKSISAKLSRRPVEELQTAGSVIGLSRPFRPLARLAIDRSLVDLHCWMSDPTDDADTPWNRPAGLPRLGRCDRWRGTTRSSRLRERSGMICAPVEGSDLLHGPIHPG